MPGVSCISNKVGARLEHKLGKRRCWEIRAAAAAAACYSFHSKPTHSKITPLPKTYLTGGLETGREPSSRAAAAASIWRTSSQLVVNNNLDLHAATPRDHNTGGTERCHINLAVTQLRCIENAFPQNTHMRQEAACEGLAASIEGAIKWRSPC